MKVEDWSFTATTDVTTAASICSVFVSVLLTPSVDGTFALQWASLGAPKDHLLHRSLG